ncbi:Exonuclease I [Pseudoloma neurophilia]|uniref:Exonuclease 1 n=1 Tax=Pseudoloma neurophilia TaxID=146866 RepID=A0A0R0M087_9MICR|nr:Exonuclease I [Pseudoloma neurophilia]
MGINNLLPMVSPLFHNKSLDKFKDTKIGIDGHAWLHTVILPYAYDLFFIQHESMKNIIKSSKPKNVVYKKIATALFHRLTPLINLGIKITLVFDGAIMPQKIDENIRRRNRRQESADKAIMLYKQKDKQYFRYMQSAIGITTEMVKMVCEIFELEYGANVINQMHLNNQSDCYGFLYSFNTSGQSFVQHSEQNLNDLKNSLQHSEQNPDDLKNFVQHSEQNPDDLKNSVQHSEQNPKKFVKISAKRPATLKILHSPFESDGQLFYLQKIGVIDHILTEDSDLIVHGAESVLYKFKNGCVQHYSRKYVNESIMNSGKMTSLLDKSNQSGTSTLKRRKSSLTPRSSLSSSLDTDQKLSVLWQNLLEVSILAGCDYLENIPNLGMNTVIKHIVNLNIDNDFDLDTFLRNLPIKFNVPENYRKRFELAKNTFQYQIVFDPFLKKYVFKDGQIISEKKITNNFEIMNDVKMKDIQVKQKSFSFDTENVKNFTKKPSDYKNTKSVILSPSKKKNKKNDEKIESYEVKLRPAVKDVKSAWKRVRTGSRQDLMRKMLDKNSHKG